MRRRRIYWFTYSFNKCRAREVREMMEEDMGPTHQSRWERVPTTKAVEQEKMGTTIGREWEDSNKDSMGDVIEAQMDVPKVPQPARRQY